MAGTLPVGSWSWHERWLYPDQLYDRPDAPLSKDGQPTDRLEKLPEIPRRYMDGTFRRMTSSYCDEYRHPTCLNMTDMGVQSTKPSAPAYHREFIPGMRRNIRERGRKPTNWSHMDAYQGAIRSEQQSFRLWGRLNPAHCIVPYETESQKSFRGEKPVDPVNSEYHTKVTRKDYKEALAKEAMWMKGALAAKTGKK